MHNLLNKKCIPCESRGLKPFTRAEAEDYLAQISSWALDENTQKISKEYKFKDFIGSKLAIKTSTAIFSFL